MPLYTYIPSTNIPAKYQLTATFYISKTCTDKILMVFYYGKIKVKSRSIHDLAHLHPQPIFPAKNQLTTPNSLQDIPKQDFKGQGHYSKVKGQIKVTTGLCTLTSLSNLPAKYQLATLYSLHGMPGLDFRARSLHSIGKIQISHTMMLHTYTPNQYPCLVLTSYTSFRDTVSVIQPGPNFPNACHPNQTSKAKTIQKLYFLYRLEQNTA